MNKKAQGATEYLIVLAIVIIIALIVIGVMGGIPGIGGGAKSRASQSFWSTSDVAFVSYAIDGTNVILNTRNNFRDTITIQNVSLDGTDLAVSQTMKAGQTKKLTSTAVTCTAGDAFSYDVSILYTNEETGANYTYNGDGTKLEGTCAD